MANDLNSALVSSVAALRAQSIRLRVVSENLANANATASTPGGDPYARKTVSFRGELDRASGASVLKINSIGRDNSPFRLQYDPGHPAANASGNVKLPNIDPLIELSDMREAHRSYDANLQIVRQTRGMIGDLIDLMRGK